MSTLYDENILNNNILNDELIINKINQIITDFFEKHQFINNIYDPSISSDDKNMKNIRNLFPISNEIQESIKLPLLKVFNDLLKFIKFLELKNQQQIDMIHSLIKHFIKLPETDLNEICFIKEGESSVREKEIHLKKCMIDIEQQINKDLHEYGNNKSFKEFMIINNNNRDVKNPQIILSKCKRRKHVIQQSDVLGVRIVNETTPIPALIGQKETFCKTDLIPKGTIIGQYSGFEINQDKWSNHFGNTENYYKQAPYLYNVEWSGGEFVIDPKMGLNKDNPLLYINDARLNIDCNNLKIKEQKRCNVTFKTELFDGWPVLYIEATKDIKYNHSLWTDYGPEFGITVREIKNGRKYEETTYPERQKLLNKILNKHCYINKNNHLFVNKQNIFSMNMTNNTLNSIKNYIFIKKKENLFELNEIYQQRFNELSQQYTMIKNKIEIDYDKLEYKYDQLNKFMDETIKNKQKFITIPKLKYNEYQNYNLSFVNNTNNNNNDINDMIGCYNYNDIINGNFKRRKLNDLSSLST